MSAEELIDALQRTLAGQRAGGGSYPPQGDPPNVLPPDPLAPGSASTGAGNDGGIVGELSASTGAGNDGGIVGELKAIRQLMESQHEAVMQALARLPTEIAEAIVSATS